MPLVLWLGGFIAIYFHILCLKLPCLQYFKLFLTLLSNDLTMYVFPAKLLFLGVTVAIRRYW